MLIFAHGTENAYTIRLFLLREKMLTKFACIFLLKSLLTKFAYQNLFIEEFAFICLKTSFMLNYFRPLSFVSRPCWNLVFCD